jgi:hypothetical protein
MTMFHGQPNDSSAPPNLHWGHIAVYYLVQQMHRWERFVFRFDKGFGSIAALKSITGLCPECAVLLSYKYADGYRLRASA